MVASPILDVAWSTVCRNEVDHFLPVASVLGNGRTQHMVSLLVFDGDASLSSL